jgi:hypothetical protein
MQLSLVSSNSARNAGYGRSAGPPKVRYPGARRRAPREIPSASESDTTYLCELSLRHGFYSPRKVGGSPVRRVGHREARMCDDANAR